MLVNIKSRAARAAREQALTEFAIRLIEDVPLTRCHACRMVLHVQWIKVRTLCVYSEGLFVFLYYASSLKAAQAAVHLLLVLACLAIKARERDENEKINLRDMYPFYQTDVWIEVDEEIVQEMRRFELLESAYKLRAYRHRAYYSLDRNDGIENDILFPSRSTETEYEEMAFRRELYAAMCRLPKKSFRRIYAHYFLGMSKVAIARVEQVDEKAVRKSIESGLKKLKQFLGNK